MEERQEPKPRVGRLVFEVSGDPIAQPRHRISGRGRYIAKLKDGSEHPIHRWKALIKDECRRAVGRVDWQGYNEPIFMVLHFWMPRTKGMIWKQKPMVSVPHVCKPDLDNLVKAVKDAIKGLAYNDDSQVYAMEATKQYSGLAPWGSGPGSDFVEPGVDVELIKH